MIQSSIFRNFAKLLLILLVVAFVFWGFGDAFRKKEVNYAIKVGNIEYSYQHWDEIVNNNIKEATIKYGRGLSAQEVNILKQQLAKKVIDSTLLYIEAKNLGIVADDNMVKKEILKIPVFFKDSKFNKDLFDQTIKSHGLSEETFIREIKEQLIRNIFVNSFLGNKLTIPQLIQIILEDILESREIELIRIPFKAFKITTTLPKKEDLKTIYEQNKEHFKVPEKRNISYITISLEGIKGQIKEVDEKELYNIYKQKSSLFIEPEERRVRQIQFSLLDNAKKARAELTKGGEFEMVAKKHSPNFKKVSLGIITRKDFEDKVSDKLFKLSEGEVSDVIETPSGIYLFKIVEAIPPKTKKYSEVKELIRNEYLKEIQFNKFLELIKEIQAQLKDGKDMTLIAKNYNLEIKQTEVSKDIVNNKAESKLFIENAFKTPLNSLSSLLPISSNKFCILRVDKVIDEKIKGFVEVQTSLRKIWYDQKIADEANRLSFTEDYKSKNNRELIDFKDVKIMNMIVTRDNMRQDVPLVFLQQFFSLGKAQFTKPYVDKSNKEVLFAKLNKISLPSASKIQKYRDLYKSQIQQIEQEAILTEILHHLRKKYEVKISQTTMNR